MQILSEQKQFWLNWGWNDHAIHYTLKDFRKVTSFEEEFLYKLLWQDEQGKELDLEESGMAQGAQGRARTSCASSNGGSLTK